MVLGLTVPCQDKMWYHERCENVKKIKFPYIIALLLKLLGGSRACSFLWLRITTTVTLLSLVLDTVWWNMWSLGNVLP